MLFDDNIVRKKDEYPWANKLMQSMWDNPWSVNKFNFSSDIQDFKVTLSEKERGVVIRALSAIAQIEVAVKTFWGKLGDNLPPLRDLGYVMANVETVHNFAYEKLLDVLGLSDIFEENLKVPVIAGRVNYLRKHTHRFYSDSKKQYVYALCLFTFFVENVSLFSQFYIMNWLNRNKNVLKTVNQQILYTKNEECLISGTEILTPSGWRNVEDIQVGDVVCQYHDDLTISFAKTTSTIAKKYTGKMYEIARKRNRCIVTPRHDMFYFDRNNTPTKKHAQDIKFHRDVKVPVAGVLVNEGVRELSWMERLYIAIQADGTRRRWRTKNGEVNYVDSSLHGALNYSLTVKKQRKIDRLRLILSKANIRYTESLDKRGFTVFRVAIPNNIDYKNFNWVHFGDKSADWCDDFVRELTNWDGYITDNGCFGYSSTNKSCIDIAQTAAILAGYSTGITPGRERLRKPHYKNCYRMLFFKENPAPISHGLKKSEINYDGYVYCVSVPSGNIITRYQDKTFILGNCVHALAGTQIINTLRKEYPDIFDAEMEEKILTEADAAVGHEIDILKWMLEDYSGAGLDIPTCSEMIKFRMNQSLEGSGFKSLYKIDPELKKKFWWFEEELKGTNFVDFFHQHSVDYAKNNASFAEEDLF